MRVFLLVLLAGLLRGQTPVFPGREWAVRNPADAGLKPAHLEQVAGYLGGRGMIVRGGYQVFAWGEASQRADIASAAKPFYSHLLFRAVESGRLAGVDTPLVDFEPRLHGLNAALQFKDRHITFRHCANQVSGYGVQEPPGAAFAYNDFQMTLFWETLVRGVYRTTPAEVDRAVFRPLLTDLLGCQDQPSMLAFGVEARPGRVAISPRDHCRFGLLYLRHGFWPAAGGGGLVSLIASNHVALATRSPLPLSLPRTRAQAAEMIPGQRSMGSRRIPDDQTDHFGCYSWLWWVNGVRAPGRRLWPDAPADAFGALGHEHGMRGLIVIPSLDLVMAWNDTTLDRRPWTNPVSDPHPLNVALRLLAAASRP